MDGSRINSIRRLYTEKVRVYERAEVRRQVAGKSLRGELMQAVKSTGGRQQFIVTVRPSFLPESLPHEIRVGTVANDFVHCLWWCQIWERFVDSIEQKLHCHVGYPGVVQRRLPLKARQTSPRTLHRCGEGVDAEQDQ